MFVAAEGAAKLAFQALSQAWVNPKLASAEMNLPFTEAFQ